MTKPPCLLLSSIACANPLLLAVALLVLATYKELLPQAGLRRLVLINILCGCLEVWYSISVCMCTTFFYARDLAA